MYKLIPYLFIDTITDSLNMSNNENEKFSVDIQSEKKITNENKLTISQPEIILNKKDGE
jgi:hypothetical protein